MPNWGWGVVIALLVVVTWLLWNQYGPQTTLIVIAIACGIAFIAKTLLNR